MFFNSVANYFAIILLIHLRCDSLVEAQNPTTSPSTNTLDPYFTVLFSVSSKISVTDDEVLYSCATRNDWTSAANSNVDLINGTEWNSPIMVSHSSDFRVWGPGTLTTPGFDMALQGSSLESLADEGINNIAVGDVEIGQALLTMLVNEQTLPDIAVSASYPLLSTLSIATPGGEWFTGFHDFDPRDKENNTWLREFTIETYLWDAKKDVSVGLNRSSVLPVTFWSCILPGEPESSPLVGDIAPTESSLLSSNDETDKALSLTSSNVPLSEDASYSCTVQNLWNETRHPNLYPEDTALWSPPILVAHTSNYTMWKPGALASEGIEKVAEEGIPRLFTAELARGGIQRRIETILDIEIGHAMPIYRKVSEQHLPGLIVTSDYPLISSFSKISPSPDWFSGFYDFDARNLTTGTWYREFIIETGPIDAGTESGSDYTKTNQHETPHQPIYRLTVDTIPSDTGVFLNPQGTAVLPVARWSCSLTTTFSGSSTPTSEPSDTPPISSSPTQTIEATTSTLPSMTPAPTSVTTAFDESNAPTSLLSLSPTIEITTSTLPITTPAPTAIPTKTFDVPTDKPSSLLSAWPTLETTTNTLLPSSAPTTETIATILPAATSPPGGSYGITSSTPSNISTAIDVSYSCIFENLWTVQRHPNFYPVGAAWSESIVIAHGSNYTMWGPGELLSKGLGRFIEDGSTIMLRIETLISQVAEMVKGDPMLVEQGRQSLDGFSVTADRPLISTIINMEPSPDWFTGFYDFDARDVSNNATTWYRTFTIETYPWDAGINDGIFFSNTATRTSPPEPIMQFTAETVPQSTRVFLSRDQSTVLPVAQWHCSLENPAIETSEASLRTTNTKPFDVRFPSGPSTVSALEDDARYSCDFQNLWTSNRHPNLYPDDGYWTRPVIVSHSDEFSMWSPGTLATEGVQLVARDGSNTVIAIEALRSGLNVRDYEFGGTMFVEDALTAQTLPDIVLTPSNPYLSGMTRLHPSPDWFTGFYHFDLRDNSTDTWHSQFILETYPFDAGVESGDLYQSSNPAEESPQLIFQLTKDTVPVGTQVFLSPNGTTVLPVGRWHCYLVSPIDYKSERTNQGDDDDEDIGNRV